MDNARIDDIITPEEMRSLIATVKRNSEILEKFSNMLDELAASPMLQAMLPRVGR